MAQPRVLLAHYNPRQAESLGDALRAEGYTVHVCSDGKSALSTFSEVRPHVVVLEAMIPGKNGFEVCRELKALPEASSVPVVITSGIHRGSRYRTDAMSSYGCQEFLERGFSAKDLVSTIRQLLPGAFLDAPEPGAHDDSLDAAGRREPGDSDGMPSRHGGPLPEGAEDARPGPPAATALLDDMRASGEEPREPITMDEGEISTILETLFPEQDSGDLAAMLASKPPLGERLAGMERRLPNEPQETDPTSVATEASSGQPDRAFDARPDPSTVSKPDPASGAFREFEDAEDRLGYGEIDADTLSELNESMGGLPTAGFEESDSRFLHAIDRWELAGAATRSEPADDTAEPAIETHQPAPPALPSRTASAEPESHAAEEAPEVHATPATEVIPEAHATFPEDMTPTVPSTRAADGEAELLTALTADSYFGLRSTPAASTPAPALTSSPFPATTPDLDPRTHEELSPTDAAPADMLSFADDPVRTTLDAQEALRSSAVPALTSLETGNRRTPYVLGALAAAALVVAGLWLALTSGTEAPSTREASLAIPTDDAARATATDYPAWASVQPSPSTMPGDVADEAGEIPVVVLEGGQPVDATPRGASASPQEPPASSASSAKNAGAGLTAPGPARATEGIAPAVGSKPPAGVKPPAGTGTPSRPIAEATSNETSTPAVRSASDAEGPARSLKGVGTDNADGSTGQAAGAARQSGPGADGGNDTDPAPFLARPTVQAVIPLMPPAVVPSLLPGGTAARAVPQIVSMGDADEPPRCVSRLAPAYPAAARALRLEGEVAMNILVLETGEVSEVMVLQGAHPILAQAAVEAVKSWRYVPGRKNGRAVRTWTTERVEFRLK